MRGSLVVAGALAALLFSAPALAADADVAKGEQVFKLYCASCHGDKGDGQGPVGKTLNPPPRNFQTAEFKYGSTDKDIFEVISNGAASKGGSPLMAPWGAVIPEADRHALVKFIRSLKGAR
jgi:mono/diheme cytochrome c family protein